MMLTRIYLCGAHSCGKSTLLKELSLRHGFLTVEEAAREIIEEGNVELSSFSANALSADAFQATVAKRHRENHECALKNAADLHAPGIVFDRGPDNLVYAALFATNAGAEYRRSKEYLDSLQEPGALVFLIDPHEDLIESDGVRKSLDMQTLQTITHGIAMLLEWNDIPYVRLQSPDLLQRLKTIDAVIQISHDSK